jgi:CopG family nickel-responsive transcriptional regulator
MIKLVNVSFSIPKDLLKELDRTTKRKKSATRSEVTRQALNSYISKYNAIKEDDREVLATITALRERVDNQESPDIQHGYSDIVVQYLHTHISENNCLGVLVIKGKSKRFKELIDCLKADLHISQLEFFIMNS